MWPLPQIKNEHIHLVLYPNRAVCVRFVPEQGYVRLQDYRSYSFALGNAQLFFNITQLSDVISNFITSFDLQAAYLNIVLTPDLVQERLVQYAKSDATLEDLQAHAMHTAYQLQYVGPHEDAFLFYICGISQVLKLQLGLIHNRLPVHMYRVISPLHAQIEVYKRIAAPAFSQARLVHELHMQRVQIPAVFSPEVLRRAIKIESNTSFVHEDIVYAWGSFLGAQ